MPRFQGGLNTRTEQGYGNFTRTLPLSGQGESGTFKPPCQPRLCAGGVGRGGGVSIVVQRSVLSSVPVSRCDLFQADGRDCEPRAHRGMSNG